jgi:hypothetical protein
LKTSKSAARFFNVIERLTALLFLALVSSVSQSLAEEITLLKKS